MFKFITLKMGYATDRNYHWHNPILIKRMEMQSEMHLLKLHYNRYCYKMEPLFSKKWIGWEKKVAF